MARAWALLLGLLLPTQALAQAERVVEVIAATETDPVDEDPDDPAIWINGADPAQSRVIGTDKEYGLLVFDLDGRLVQRLPDGRLNNVDIRQDVSLGGETISLVVASKREDNTIAFYTVDGTGTLARATPFALPGSPDPVGDDIYGIALYQGPGGLDVIASFKTGDVVQWRIGGTASALTLTHQRSWMMPSQPEGVVADDSLGFIYVGEEDGGIWRYPADPERPAEGVLVDAVGSTCLPVDDVEGLAIYRAGPDSGYLVASAQGVNQYALYPRRPDAEGRQACIGSVAVATGPTDPVSETDGLEVTATPLGEAFPSGMMVVQDDRNEGFTRNFKFVSWAEIEHGLNLVAE